MDFEAIKQTYTDFATKHGITLAIDRQGFDAKDQQFKFRATLAVLGRNETLDNPYFCGVAVPMNDPEVIKQVKRGYTPIGMKAVFVSSGRISMAQDEVNQRFIRAASAHYQPSIVDILGCLRSDLSCVYYPGDGFAVTFSDFCSELGYNDDSIKDKEVYRAVMEQSQKFVRLLGAAAIAELLELENL